MKKIIKALFVIALLFQVVPSTFVKAETNNNNGKITINNAVSGNTYSVYQMLKLESYNKTDETYYYTVVSIWNDFIENDGKDYLKVENGHVEWVGDKTADRVQEFAQKALKYAIDNGIAPTKTTTAESATVVFSGLNLGYYLLDSSLGTFCSIDTTDNEVAIEEKNTVPTLEKEVEENGTYGSTNDEYIGKEYNYKATITIGKGAINYVFRDTMTSGITLVDDSITVAAKKSDGTTVDTTGKYTTTLTKSATETFRIVFDNDLVKEIGVNGTITITYKAKLNENAIIGGNGNPNTAIVDFGDDNTVNHTPESTTTTYTYGFDLVKTNKEGSLLEGAEFELRDAQNNKINVEFVETKDGINYYRVTQDTTTTAISAGIARIVGLDKGTYTLKETKIPDGYNKIGSDPTITLTNSNNYATIEANLYKDGGVRVVNYTGSELPSTGGIGTTMFITIGSLMVMAFGTLLITKFRMYKENN